MSTHIETMLVYETSKALERLQRRGIGFIDKKNVGSVDYVVDGTVYEVTVKVKGNTRKGKKKGEKANDL